MVTLSGKNPLVLLHKLRGGKGCTIDELNRLKGSRQYEGNSAIFTMG